jgi:hypothetical protein
MIRMAQCRDRYTTILYTVYTVETEIWNLDSWANSMHYGTQWKHRSSVGDECKLQFHTNEWVYTLV